MTVCIGYAELCDGGALQRRRLRDRRRRARAVTARCTSRPGNPWRTQRVTRFAAFDTPVGRIGMLIDYDKTFPESARTLALDGARIIAALSAWPASVTDRAARMTQDRQSRLFDLYDSARAAENQVVLVSSNQTGIRADCDSSARPRSWARAATCSREPGTKGGLAVAELDVDAEVNRARKVLRHLEERRIDTYRRLLDRGEH